MEVDDLEGDWLAGLQDDPVGGAEQLLRSKVYLHPPPPTSPASVISILADDVINAQHLGLKSTKAGRKLFNELVNFTVVSKQLLKLSTGYMSLFVGLNAKLINLGPNCGIKG